MSTPRIVVDGVFFQIGRSGIARVWTKLFERWIEAGLADHIVVIDRGHTMPRLPGLQYVDLPPFQYGDQAGDSNRVQLVCDAAQADVFISTYYTYPVHTPSLMMVHDMIPEVLGWNLTEPMWAQKQQALAYASAYVAVSGNTARDLRKHLSDSPRPIDITPNGCDFHPATPEATKALRAQLQLHQPYFLLSGTRSDYKNARLFFEAFSLLGPQRANFSVLCTGGGELEPDFKAMAGPAMVKVAILSDADMAVAYSGALALVYPSIYEGFGLPVLEALACACPVISSDAASLPEVGGDAPLYVHMDGPEPAQQLAQHLLAVLDSSRRADMINRGLLQASQFSWQAMADQVMAALTKLARTSERLPDRLAADDVLLPGAGCDLVLPAGHLLPQYLAEHRLYDRFLPFLAAELPAGATVIDVGANCGDTLMSMCAGNPALHYVCIEPDDTYYRYLDHNTARLRKAHPTARVQLVKALVGKAVTEAVLAGDGGSRHAKPTTSSDADSPSVRSMQLDEIVRQQPDEVWQTVRLLKSDVDGFDHDVLASALELIQARKPVLFFECFLGNATQKEAYEACLTQLAASGYTHFWVFDNFGNPMFRACEASQVVQMLSYVWRQTTQQATRSIFYLDILAASTLDVSIADAAVAAFLAAT